MVAFKFCLEHLNLLVREPRPTLLVLLTRPVLLVALALAALFGGCSCGSGSLFLATYRGRFFLVLVIFIVFVLVVNVVDARIFILLFALWMMLWLTDITLLIIDWRCFFFFANLNHFHLTRILRLVPKLIFDPLIGAPWEYLFAQMPIFRLLGILDWIDDGWFDRGHFVKVVGIYLLDMAYSFRNLGNSSFQLGFASRQIYWGKKE